MFTCIVTPQDLIKKCDNEVDMLNRQQKRDVEKLELAQNADHKSFVKKLKMEQVRAFLFVLHKLLIFFFYIVRSLVG